MSTATSTNTTTETTETDGTVIGFRALAVPYGATAPGDDRIVDRSTLENVSWELPIPVTVQWTTSPSHDNSEMGLACITEVTDTPDGLMVSGPIDVEDPRGQALARKIRDGYISWSSAEIISERPSSTSLGRRHDTWRITGLTLLARPAFERSRVWPVTDPSRIIPADQVRNTVENFAAKRQFFAVIGDTDLPWAPRDTPWDGDAAARRVREWADGDVDRMDDAFLWRNPDADPATLGAYSLGFADVIDGELRAVYRGLSAAAGRLDQTRNGMTQSDREKVRERINTLYEAAAQELGIDSREDMNMDDEPTLATASGDDDVLSERDRLLVEAIVEGVVTKMREQEERDIEEIEAEMARREALAAALGDLS